ncbi:diacylglycerol kinase family protein [uncultured Sphingomonas sp.]|uniref:diacylglycerol kinase family protein n=1 Tax=uncultured Sphingomonas sp. TaxID=158754 RepID=UPI0025EC6E10|nr:diacylglycerol kinase family protein [uncultured Sphingomonas sp.]
MAVCLAFAEKRWRSLRHAAHGVCRLVRAEAHARIHLAATLLVGIAGLALRVSMEAWRWLILACALVWVAEALNTAIERLADRVCAAHDPAIGAAKDLAAAAVLLAAVAVLAIGASLVLPVLAGARS